MLAARRAAGARVGVGDASRPLVLSVASVCPQSGPDGVNPRPEAGVGGGPGAPKGRGWGPRRAPRPGSLEPRVPGTLPARPWTSHASVGLSFPAVKRERCGVPPFDSPRTGGSGRILSEGDPDCRGRRLACLPGALGSRLVPNVAPSSFSATLSQGCGVRPGQNVLIASLF